MAYIATQAIETAKKAPTGPNPQNRIGQTIKNTTGYPNTAVGGGPAGGGNPGVTSPGPTTPGTTAPQSTAPPTPAASPPTYDYLTDPVLVQINAQQQMVIAQAQASALAQQKAALIAYGDPSLAMSVLGDQATADAAAANPTSTLATLAATNATNIRSTNETENKSNLFYSSDRGYQLGLGQQAYLANQASAASSLQSSLGGISTNLLASEQAAYNAEAQAQEDAYNRALANPVGVTPTATPTTSGAAASAISTAQASAKANGLSTGSTPLQVGPGAIAGITPTPTATPGGVLTAAQKLAAGKVGLTQSSTLAQALASSQKQSRLG